MNIDEADLAAAFSEEAASPAAPETPTSTPAPEAASAHPKRKGPKHPLSKLRKISIGVLAVGIVALVAGIGFLVYQLVSTPGADDADFLVQVKTWQREDAPSVVWEFSEIGKGSLSTNAGENIYDFDWSFDDGKLKIDTDWLYTLNDEYEFSLNQGARTFTLKTDDETLTFIPANQPLSNTSDF